MTNRQKSITLYVVSFTGLLLWLTAIFLAPFFKSTSNSWGDFLYSLFSPVCHQISERCFFVFGFPMAVCTRCLGIYTGCLLGMILYPLIHGFANSRIPPLRLFVFLTTPIAFDTFGNFASLWSTSPELRFFIGFLWGVILPFYFISGLSDAVQNKKSLEIHQENKLE